MNEEDLNDLPTTYLTTEVRPAKPRLRDPRPLATDYEVDGPYQPPARPFTWIEWVAAVVAALLFALLIVVNSGVR